MQCRPRRLRAALDDAATSFPDRRRSPPAIAACHVARSDQPVDIARLPGATMITTQAL